MLSTDRAGQPPVPGRPRLIRRRGAGAVSGRTPAGTPLPAGTAIESSTTQRLMWTVHQEAPHAAVHNVFVAFRLRGALDPHALSAALDAVVDRHATLRTTFTRAGRQVLQVIQPAPAVPLPTTDLAPVAPADRDRAMGDVLRAESRAPFALESAPLLRARLIRLAGDEHVLALTMHHIAVDGESVRLLLADLATAYAAARRGEPAGLPPLPAQYADVAALEAERIRSGRAAEDLAYWRDRLAGLEPVTLATDRPAPDRPSYRGAVVQRPLTADLVTGLTRLGSAHHASAFVVFTAGLTALLHRSTGRRDIVVGAAFGGRPAVALEHVAGPFMRLLPLRTAVGDDPTFADLLDRVRGTVLDAVDHQQMPFAEVVEAVAPVREPGRHPLARISLTVQPYAPARAGLAGLEVSPIDTPAERVEFDVEFGVRQDAPGREATLWAKYATDLFDEPRIERALDEFVCLLTAAAARPQTRVSQLPLLSGAEASWRARVCDGGPPVSTTATSVHGLIVPALARHAGTTAVTDGTVELTGADLLDRSARLARRLRALGVGPDRPVGVCLARSAAAVVAQLGVLRAGGAFLPLDPAHPPARRAAILQDAGATVVLAAGAADDFGAGVDVLAVGPDGTPDGPALDLPIDDPEQSGASLAYVLYTSGSTGSPKGVMIDHAAALVHLADVVRRFGIGCGDRFLQSAANTFDASITQILAPPAAGATVCVAPEQDVTSPARLARFMAGQKVTLAVLTPTLLTRLPDTDLPALRLLGIAGERVPGPLARAWCRPGRAVINLYGPTETVVEILAHECSPDSSGDPPIGRPLPGRRAYAVDAAGAFAPVGDDAELWIGGAGLARGYLGRPGLTAERFVPDPFGAAGSRVYRTGDLVRQRGDGEIDFVGRADHQIKISGIRVEPAETEAALRRRPGVREVVVVPVTDRRGVRLIAYLTVDGATGDRDEDRLRAALAAELPRHLVPSRLVVLDELPMTRTGKVDRAALPPPRVDAAPDVAGDTTLAGRIAAKCAELLEIGHLDPGDDLFARGATSVDVMDLMAWTQAEFGVTLEAADVFAEPTAYAVAGMVRRAIEAADAALLDEIGALPDDEATRQLEAFARTAAAAATEPDGKGAP